METSLSVTVMSRRDLQCKATVLFTLAADAAFSDDDESDNQPQ